MISRKMLSVLLAMTVLLSVLCSTMLLPTNADNIGTPPGNAEDYEQKKITVLENFLNVPASNAFAATVREEVTDIPEVSSAYSYVSTLLQASSTTSNNDFRYISSTKKDGLPSDKTNLFFSIWVRYTPKAGVSDTLSQKIRFQFRESVVDTTQASGYNSGDNIYGDMTVIGDGEWHLIEMPVSEMTGAANFDGAGAWTVVFTSLKGNTFAVDDVIEFANVQVRRYEWVLKNNGRGAYPGDDYEEGTAPIMTDFLNPPVTNAFAEMSLTEVDDIPGVNLAKSYYAKILQASSTTGNNDFRYISSTRKTGFPAETQYMILTLWARYTPAAGASDISQKIRFQFKEALDNGNGTYSGGDNLFGDAEVAGDGEWHKILLPVADMTGGANLNGCGVWTMTFTSLRGNTFAVDDVIEFADVKFEKPVWVLKNNGRGEYPGNDYEEGTETVLANFLNVPGSNAFATTEKVDATDIPGVVLAESYKSTLLQASSTTANNDFRYISTTKKYGLPDETSNLYFGMWVRYNPKSGASDTLLQKIRVTVREAVDNNGTYEGGDTVYGDIQVKGDGNWQFVSLPIADMVGGSNFDGCGIWTVTFTSLKGNTFAIDDVIEFADVHIEKPVWVLKNNGMGACPGEDYEPGSVSVLQDFLNVPAGNDFANIERFVVADLPDNSTAYNYRMELLQNSSTTANNDFRYISTSKKDGLPEEKDNLYVAFWVRYTPKNENTQTQKFRMQIRETVDDGSGTYASGDLIYGDFVVNAGSEWTRVELPVSDMVGAANFDGCGVWTVIFTSMRGNNLAQGDVVEFAGIEFRKPAWVLKNDGMGASPGEDYIIGQEIYWNNSATLITRIVKESLSMKHEIVNIDEAEIDSTKAYKTTFGDAADFNEHKLYYMFYPDATNVNDGIDMSAVMDEMRVGFWFKTPEGRDNMTFRLSLFDNKWVGYLNKDFVITKGGQWQYVEIKFADMTPYREIVSDNMGRMEIRLLDTANGIADGESFYITDIRMFTRKWVVKPDLYEDNLGQYDNPYKTQSNVLFVHTAEDNVDVSGDITVEKSTACNGDYFDSSREITTAAPESNWSVVLDGKDVNLLDVYDTAALRLFVKVPKDNIRLVVGLVDAQGNTLTTNVLVAKKDVWQEVQIRPSKLKSAGFDRTAISGVIIGSEYKSTHSDKYLAAGQKILVGGVEIYDNSPVRKNAGKVYTEVIAEAIDSNFLLLPGSYGTGIDIRPDYVNLMSGRSTWQVYLRRDSRKGISMGIPLPQEWDLSNYKDFGYLSFAITSNRYTSLNLEITDGENVYTQDVTAAEGWMEYRVYFHDVAAAGVDTSKIEEITIVRNRTLGEGCVINITELTACSDLFNVSYVSEKVPVTPQTPPTTDEPVNTPSSEPADTDLPEEPSKEDDTDSNTNTATKPQKQKHYRKVITSGLDTWVIVLIIAGSVIALGGATWFLIVFLKKRKNKKNN